MNNHQIIEEEIEFEKERQELDEFVDKIRKSTKKPDLKPPITDDHGFFEYPDNLEPRITESGDLIDDSNPFDDDYS